jgi:hypothetical protein
MEISAQPHLGIASSTRDLRRGPLAGKSNQEMDEKRALYFEAGAREVWICGLDG